MGVELSRTRKKLVATANRREGVLSRTGEPSVTFCEKEEQGSGRMAYFLSQTKNKPEQSELCSDVVEAGRVELPSEHLSSWLSPSAVGLLKFPGKTSRATGCDSGSLYYVLKATGSLKKR